MGILLYQFIYFFANYIQILRSSQRIFSVFDLNLYWGDDFVEILLGLSRIVLIAVILLWIEFICCLQILLDYNKKGSVS